MRERAEAMARSIQDTLCAAVTELDGGPPREDVWQRAEGGGGLTRLFSGGAVFEKAGVSFASVSGALTAQMASSLKIDQKIESLAGVGFFATGVSTVLHPRNAHAPTAHANYRYIEIVYPGSEQPAMWWFGGGGDLTPAYLYEDDARHFHAVHKAVLDRFDSAYYPRFKKWCDDYFFLPHRGETRGVGGVFFDRLHEGEPQRLLTMCRELGEAFVEAYIPLVARRKDTVFDDAQRRWQQLRRGRYVEFNLLYDRGTSFGLRSGGRVESILMSMPLTARWEYDFHPVAGSEEAALAAVLQSPRDWLD